MNRVLTLYKPVGATPLDVLYELQERNPGYKDVRLAYAGRLDPMAEGLLLVLVGDECKRRDHYQKLDKIYEFEVLFGVSTDTYDILGKITSTKHQIPNNLILQIKKIIPEFIGEHDQPYPPYSAARVNGKPLYWWARQGRIDECNIPSKRVNIYDLKFKGYEEKTTKELETFVVSRINKVKGDFRQNEIKKDWDTFFKKYMDQSFVTASFTIHCSSGTYVRSLAHEMGLELGVRGIALQIKRKKIGTFFKEDNQEV